MGSTAAIPEVRKKMGAPTSYRPEYCEQLIEYFQARPLTLRVLKTHESENIKDNVRTICSEVPTFQGFAESIETTDHVLRTWARKWADFAASYARAKQMQEKFFTDGLSTGVMNPTGAIFVAKNILGWRDKIDIDSTSTVIDAGSNVMALCLASSPPDLIAEFRNVLDRMKAYAVSAGTLTEDGRPLSLQAPAISA